MAGKGPSELGGHFTNKMLMCFCVPYNKVVMLSVLFEPKLMKIEGIELELFKF